MNCTLFAHSARPERGILAQPYDEHVAAVIDGASRRARRAVVYHDGDKAAFLRGVATGATFHDMGKVEDIKQAVLRSSSRVALPGVRHEEAGIAHLLSYKDEWAASLVDGHHTGLFDNTERRNRITSEEPQPAFGLLDPEVRHHVYSHLADWYNQHEAEGCWCGSPLKTQPPQPVKLRLALSCLVDADHSDTSNHQWGTQDPISPRRRWRRRLDRVMQVAAEKPKQTDRDLRRQMFFNGCLAVETDSRVMSCMAPVGSGKTLGVMAHLLKVANARSLRHIFVVLPYTNIISQAVKEYRAALVLDGEDPEEVVAELHHQAEFASMDSRQLAALWRSPIIVTTAVGFFETLAGSKPGRLRKLHELPGSAIFVDEAHAALPQHLWPLAWRWIEALADRWRAHFVLGSGSLFRFWEQPGFLDPHVTRTVPELTPDPVLQELRKHERQRIQPRRQELPLSVEDIGDNLRETEGPSVVVMNTVKSAGTVGDYLRSSGFDTLHLSTVLAPIDRAVIVDKVKDRLSQEPERTWILVATSCIEAGLDFSFRRGYREAASVASLIQLGGRVRRNEEAWQGDLVSFHATGDGITAHPAMIESAAILDALLRDGEFDRRAPNELLSMAFDRSLNGQFTVRRNELSTLENQRRHPEVEKKFKVIDTDTRIVVVHKPLIDRLLAGVKIRFSELINGSVQIYGSRLQHLPCHELRDRRGLWIWTGVYDPDFLGYLADEKTIDRLNAWGGGLV